MHVNIKYKDTVFRRLFGEIPQFTELYKAIGGKIKNESSIVAVDLDDAFFYALRNDLAFKVDDRFIVFAEHQSTPSPNMPYRMIAYLAKTLPQLIDPKDLYRNKALDLPGVEFYVFYEGNRKIPKLLRLSELMEIRMAAANTPFICCNVKVIDILRSARVLGRCRTLKEYCWLNRRVEHYLKAGYDKETSIRQTLTDCHKKNILVDFLKRFGPEVNEMISMTYDYKIALEVAEEEGLEKGRQEGRIEGRQEERLNIARELRKKGLSDEDIAQCTHLTLEQIKDL